MQNNLLISQFLYFFNLQTFSLLYLKQTSLLQIIRNQQSNQMQATCKKKFLSQLQKVKSRPENQQCTQSVLIVDEKSTLVLKEIVNMQNLLDQGIKNITKINLVKKPQPNALGIYFISCQSIRLIQKDFDKKPTYFSINILVCEEIDQQSMKYVANNDRILQRLSTLKQVHFPLYYLTEQLALVSKSEEKYLKAAYQQTSYIAQEVGTKVFEGIVASFMNLSQVKVYYSDQSKFAISMANRINKAFIELSNGQPSQDQVELSNLSQKKTEYSDDLTVFVFDRNIDMVSPMVRNFYYFPMLADIFDIRDFKAMNIENIGNPKPKLNLDQSKSNLNPNQPQSLSLNPKDIVFTQYKNKHISQAITQITSDLQKFTASNKTAKFQKQKQSLSSNRDLKDVIKQLPEYTKTLKSYNINIEVMREISSRSKKEKLSEIGELEMLIITSLTSQAEVKEDKKIFKRAMEVMQTLQDVDTKVRIVYLMLQCLEISQKQKQDLYRFLEKAKGYEKFQSLFEKPTTGKLRYTPVFKKQSIYLDRHQCLIAKRILQILMQKPAKQMKTFSIELSSQGKFSKFKKLQRKNKKKLLIVMIGGLSVNEISNVERIVDRFQDYEVYFLTDYVSTPKSFLEDLKGLVREKK